VLAAPPAARQVWRLLRRSQRQFWKRGGIWSLSGRRGRASPGRPARSQCSLFKFLQAGRNRVSVAPANSQWLPSLALQRHQLALEPCAGAGFSVRDLPVQSAFSRPGATPGASGGAHGLGALHPSPGRRSRVPGLVRRCGSPAQQRELGAGAMQLLSSPGRQTGLTLAEYGAGNPLQNRSGFARSLQHVDFLISRSALQPARDQE